MVVAVTVSGSVTTMAIKNPVLATLKFVWTPVVDSLPQQ
jgi:hypothetical protein